MGLTERELYQHFKLCRYFVLCDWDGSVAELHYISTPNGIYLICPKCKNICTKRNMTEPPKSDPSEREEQVA